ncbi:hypothetical protein DC3_48880 [Deinococcus cellulosilyticus NBRC 106333 = KACC 11606]|uniref:Nuclease n=2 Tax=Deinococcus cellulosilyticus TaxID=401558 RepID=A0A511N8S4_DEIC1|nr:hypothetical protein DC3_48880 [Deinococcus cellulosilyticus NBRC 106333 = KACC 11606]
MQASSVMVFPSESDVPFSWFVSSLHRLPDAATFARSTGHAGEAAIRLNFDAFFDRHTQIQPWMDEGQQAFASRMQHLREVFQKHSQKLAVYRVGEIQVHIYIVAVVQGRVVGLETLSIET